MTFAKTTKKNIAPHLDEQDEEILDAMRKIAAAFYKKAIVKMNDAAVENVSPDEVYDLVAQSRRYSVKSSNYERKLRRIYDEKRKDAF
jgi:hypothetical protein